MRKAYNAIAFSVEGHNIWHDVTFAYTARQAYINFVDMCPCLHDSMRVYEGTDRSSPCLYARAGEIEWCIED